MTDDDFSPSIDELLLRNQKFAATFADADLQVQPTRRLAIVTCMDSRMDVFALLGLGHGEAHIIRNAGGVITDDVIRSLCLSQRALGTREVVVIHHTDCGLLKIDETTFRAELESELGIRPAWVTEAFDDPYAEVRQSIRRLDNSPFVIAKGHISGFVYDVTTGRLNRV